MIALTNFQTGAAALLVACVLVFYGFLWAVCRAAAEADRNVPTPPRPPEDQ